MALVPFANRRSQSGRPSSVFGGLLSDGSVLERLDDLRKRLVRSALAAAVGVLVGFLFIQQAVDLLLAPVRKALPAGSRLIYTEPGEAFGLYVQAALILGVVIAMPFIMYQLWQLVLPLVPAGATRVAVPFVLFTTGGFIGGAAFNHAIAFPYLMRFFASFHYPSTSPRKK